MGRVRRSCYSYVAMLHHRTSCCNTRQHGATRANTPQPETTRCNAVRHVARRDSMPSQPAPISPPSRTADSGIMRRGICGHWRAACSRRYERTRTRSDVLLFARDMATDVSEPLSAPLYCLCTHVARVPTRVALRRNVLHCSARCRAGRWPLRRISTAQS